MMILVAGWFLNSPGAGRSWETSTLEEPTSRTKTGQKVGGDKLTQCIKRRAPALWGRRAAITSYNGQLNPVGRPRRLVDWGGGTGLRGLPGQLTGEGGRRKEAPGDELLG